ncbi:MAG: hypothetical protein AAB553_03370 [Patescibacteria group bacterium]
MSDQAAQQAPPPPPPVDPAALAKDQAQIDQAAQTTKDKLLDEPALAQKLAPTPDMQAIVVDVEKDLLAEIMKNLRENTITPQDAQEVAKEFLALLPMQDKHDLLTKLRNLSTENREVTGVYLKYAKPFEDEERKEKLHLMSEHIKNGAIEEALAVAKGDK